MQENAFVKETFHEMAAQGYLGDPEGELAYCYLRVSTAQQAEEGRSGLPRQLQHCHEAASKHHLKISWDLLFADDGYSGFEFDTRPALSLLRQEIANKPRSKFVVIEHLDRLSRNARWHQGFLLDEFAKNRIEPVFWKPFSSEIERAVLGTIAEEGMRSEIHRMQEGQLIKARSGRVTAKKPRFGYMFVDSTGQVSEKTRQDTHYALHPENSKIVRWIFNCVIREHKSLGRIASEMNQTGIRPMTGRGQMWCTATIARLVNDPIYKGEFYAHRWYREENGQLNAKGRPKGVMHERPQEEWIKVAVPPIITPSQWKMAQDIIEANQKRSTRNMKRRAWLLSSFLKCDLCKTAYAAHIGGGPNRPIRYYGCARRFSDRARAKGLGCKSRYIHADQLELFVWSKVEELVEHPELVIRFLDEAYHQEDSEANEQQLAYIDCQIAENTSRYERWKEAYEAKVIPLEEYKGFRDQYLKRRDELNESREIVLQKAQAHVSLDELKQIILAGLAELAEIINQRDRMEEVPFDLKRRLLLLFLKTIWVNEFEKSIRLEGVLKATYTGNETAFVFGYNPIWR